MIRRLMFASLLCAAACGDLCAPGIDPLANPKLAAMCGVLAGAKKDGGALTVQPPDASAAPDGGAADLEHHAASKSPYEEDKPAPPPKDPPPQAPPPQRKQPDRRRA